MTKREKVRDRMSGRKLTWEAEERERKWREKKTQSPL